MISLKKIREHVDVLDTYDDHQLRRLLDAAINSVEAESNMIIKQRQIVFQCDYMPEICDELRSPTKAVDSITYIDENNATQTVPATDYVLRGDRVQWFGTTGTYFLYPEIELESGACWPSTTDKKNAFTVTYTAGFDVGDLPPGLENAIMMAIATLFENRETLGPVQLYKNPAFMMSIAPFRVVGR